MSDKKILTVKYHIWSIPKIFIFMIFFTYGQFLLKIEKKEDVIERDKE
jgi:hypothetical protein